jgi:HEAT repeat protein
MPQTPVAANPAPAKPKPPVPPEEFREGALATLDASSLVAILKDPSASEFRKAKACVRAGELGAKEAVPALAALLGDPHLSAYARYGLEPMADASADEALRAAMSKLKGDLLIGVVNSIGKRRDAKSGPVLAKMLTGPEADLARAAAAALGSIGDSASAKALRAAMSKPALKAAAADALLICAERMLSDGKRAEALDIYAGLTGVDVPKPMRLAAMNSIVREESSISRPR